MGENPAPFTPVRPKPEGSIPSNQLPPLERLHQWAAQLGDKDTPITRRTFAVGAAATLILGVTEIATKGKVSEFVRRRLLGKPSHNTEATTLPDKPFVPLSPEALVASQERADLTEIKKHRYTWVKVEDGIEVNSEEPEIVAGKLNFASMLLSKDGFSEGIRIRKGVGKGAEEITLSREEAEAQIPDMRGSFVRVRIKDPYTFEYTDKETDVAWGFVTGTNTPEGVKAFFSTPSRIPIGENESPLLVSKNFVSAAKIHTSQ